MGKIFPVIIAFLATACSSSGEWVDVPNVMLEEVGKV